MGKLTMNFLRWMLTAGLLSVCMQAQAVEQVEVTYQRSADTACLDCHKDKDYGMHGKHAKATNPNNLKPVTCTNCHGKPSPQHREGVKDVMRFSDSLGGNKGDDANSIAEQNGACMSCHEPDALRKVLWAHDVHSSKLSCASCHALHPTEEPMMGIPEESRIKLCADCHSKLHANVKAKAADAAPGKEAP